MRQKTSQTLNTKSLIEWMKRARNESGITSPDIVRQFEVSRSTAARILKKTVEEGLLTKSGSTKSATYAIAALKHQTSIKTLILTKKLAGLAEDRVFDEVDLKLNLKGELSSHAFRIAQYAFTEMLNNAIDHSQAKSAVIEVRIENGFFKFDIRDRGIGIFQRIRKTFHLASSEEAIEHLLKGKQTTAPEAHSGQGIFFTSKIADLFQIRSETFVLTIDNEKNDQRLGVIRKLKGTSVHFAIKIQTRRSLEKLFIEFANEDFEFDRSKYPVRILKQTGAISRSQARRLTFGLDKFDRIIFDFSGVTELGQGFADELFRVFQKQHPEIVLEVRNANAAVDFMIRRARIADG